MFKKIFANICLIFSIIHRSLFKPVQMTSSELLKEAFDNQLPDIKKEDLKIPKAIEEVVFACKSLGVPLVSSTFAMLLHRVNTNTVNNLVNHDKIWAIVDNSYRRQAIVDSLIKDGLVTTKQVSELCKIDPVFFLWYIQKT